MGYLDKNLVPGETVVYKTGCHWIVMFWPLLGGLVLAFFGIALFAGGWLATRKGSSYQGAIVEGAIVLAGAVGLIGGGIIRRAATEVAVLTGGYLSRGASSPEEALRCCSRRSRATALTSLYLAGCSAMGPSLCEGRAAHSKRSTKSLTQTNCGGRSSNKQEASHPRKPCQIARRLKRSPRRGGDPGGAIGGRVSQ